MNIKRFQRLNDQLAGTYTAMAEVQQEIGKATEPSEIKEMAHRLVKLVGKVERLSEALVEEIRSKVYEEK